LPQIIDDTQLGWLTTDLEAHKNARATFVFFHTEATPESAPYDSHKADHPPLGNSAALRDLFRKYGVKAVFEGHEHLFYEYDDPVLSGPRYYTAGGGGAPLYATPEHGGFSHYLVVRMHDKDVTVTVVEPGHFYVDRETHGHTAWLVNSSATPMPARRVEVKVDASAGSCADLIATATGLSMTQTCSASTHKRTLTLVVDGDVPAGKSFPIDVHTKPSP